MRKKTICCVDWICQGQTDCIPIGQGHDLFVNRVTLMTLYVVSCVVCQRGHEAVNWSFVRSTVFFNPSSVCVCDVEKIIQ